MLIEAQLMNDRRMDISEVDAVLDGMQADGIGGSKHLAAADAASGHPHAEPEIVVIPPAAGFRFGRPTEFASPQHQCRIQQAATTQVPEQCRHGLVGFGGLASMVFLDIAVGVPLLVAWAAAGDDTDKTDPVFHQFSSHEAASSVIVSWFAADSIKIQGFLGFLGEIKDPRGFGLHLECQIVRVDPRVEFIVFRGGLGPVEFPDELKCATPLIQRDALGEIEIEDRSISGLEHGGLKDGWEESLGVHGLTSLESAFRIWHDDIGWKRIAFTAEPVSDP